MASGFFNHNKKITPDLDSTDRGIIRKTLDQIYWSQLIILSK